MPRKTDRYSSVLLKPVLTGIDDFRLRIAAGLEALDFSVDNSASGNMCLGNVIYIEICNSRGTGP